MPPFIISSPLPSATTEPSVTPGTSEINNQVGSESEKEAGNVCDCEAETDDGFYIIDVIFGGDDDDYLDDDDEDSNLQRSPESSHNGDDALQLLYRRKKHSKRHGLKRKSHKKVKKQSNAGAGRGRASHRGHRRVRPELPCYPEKQTACFNFNGSSISVACDSENDFCVDDCDCPGFLKCCINACGRRECLPSYHLTVTTESPAPTEPEKQPEPAVPNGNEISVTSSAGETAASGEQVPASTSPSAPVPVAQA
jgi:hypothetical protein